MSVSFENSRIVRSRWLLLSLAIFSGLVNVWLLVGWDHINPLSLSWLADDPAQYQAAWEFLRRDPAWRFPLTWVDNLGYPLGVSTSYMDVIPLVAVPLRLASALLPADFQYLGLFAVACHALQAYFGFRLISCFAPRDTIVVIVGGLFILIAPVLTFRLYMHYVLSSQWVIVAGLYYYFRPLEQSNLGKYMRPFLVLSVVASAINPYISLFAMLIGGSAILRAYLDGRAGLIVAGLFGLVLGGLTLSTLAAFGFLVGGDGVQFAGGGYTIYSMNLLSPIDPFIFPSLLIKGRQTFAGQSEGYNYLGLGVLLLLFVALARHPALVLRMWSKPLRPLLFTSIICTVLALSVKVTLADSVLGTIPVPSAVFQALASFRASGRLFWPVHYLLILAAIVGPLMTCPRRQVVSFLLCLALVTQMADLMSLRQAISAQAQVRQADLLVSSDWASLPQRHRHLVVLPAWQCSRDQTPGGSEAWYWFARLAARSGMTVNSFYTSRISSTAIHLYCSVMPEVLGRQGPETDTAYVLGGALALAVAMRPGSTHYCRRVDGFNLCTYDPTRADQSRSLVKQLLPPYTLGTEFRAEENPPNTLILSEGWQDRSSPGRWTLGRVASVYLRPLLPQTGALRLELELAAVLLNARHPLQRAVVQVNGQALGTWEFRLGGANDSRSLTIPRGLIPEGEVMVLTLELPDAVTPQSIGINNDERVLALRIKRLRIIAAN